MAARRKSRATEPTTELVLLQSPDGDRHIVLVPDGASRHDVPNRPDVAASLRGRTFVRSGDVDAVCGWPIFQPRAWQV